MICSLIRSQCPCESREKKQSILSNFKVKKIRETKVKWLVSIYSNKLIQKGQEANPISLPFLGPHRIFIFNKIPLSVFRNTAIYRLTKEVLAPTIWSSRQGVLGRSWNDFSLQQHSIPQMSMDYVWIQE